ncbi:MAG: LamG domain protein jellyroll fold domain protein [Capsulimonas sp.]|jgi:MSHA biogenesis protein MshQ|nr:LamG domain protein jellyroll fold domain protein [Capsulimonas sp.]
MSLAIRSLRTSLPLRATAAMFALLIPITSAVAAPRAKSKPVPKEGLVAYWPGDGNGKDVVGKYNANPSPTVQYAPGKAKMGFQLDGKSAYVGVPFSPVFDLDPAGQFTVSAWVRPETVGTYQAVFVKAATKGAWDYGIIIDRQGHFYSGRDANDVAQSKTVIVPGTWYHVAVTYDNGNFKTYVNGALEAEASNTMIGKSGSGLCIGHKGEISVEGEDPDWFQGNIDELRFYNKALGADGVKMLYDANK